jgi:hypothetical protein
MKYFIERIAHRQDSHLGACYVAEWKAKANQLFCFTKSCVLFFE